jgi:hypothetical protein
VNLQRGLQRETKWWMHRELAGTSFDKIHVHTHRSGWLGCERGMSKTTDAHARACSVNVSIALKRSLQHFKHLQALLCLSVWSAMSPCHTALLLNWHLLHHVVGDTIVNSHQLACQLSRRLQKKPTARAVAVRRRDPTAPLGGTAKHTCKLQSDSQVL